MKSSFKRLLNKKSKSEAKELDKKFYKIATSLLNGNLRDSEKEAAILKLRSLI